MKKFINSIIKRGRQPAIGTLEVILERAWNISKIRQFGREFEVANCPFAWKEKWKLLYFGLVVFEFVCFGFFIFYFLS